MSALRHAIREVAPAAAPVQGGADDLLARLPGCVFSLEEPHRIGTVWGAGFEDAPGLSPGRDLLDAVGAEASAAIRAACDLARRRGGSRVCVAPPGGSAPWIQFEFARTPDGVLAGRMTDQREMLGQEQALREALADSEARSAGKSRFLASLSHELRTPLNAIMGFADAMREGALGPVPPRYRDYADLIHESGALLLELISDVLDMARVEAERVDLHPEVFDVREAASAVVRLVRGQVERAGLVFRMPDLRERIEVRADRRALKQMVLNLVSNAVKATPAGGTVAFDIAVEGRDLLLSVVDTGCGVSEADLARLGRPFEQAGNLDQKAAGSGLGLSLVKALASLHGGSLVLDSQVGKGTRATLRLPVVVRDQVQPELDLG